MSRVLEAEVGVILVGVAVGGFALYKLIESFTSPTGYGSTTQNGQPYSLVNRLFATPNVNGQVYDTTGSAGAVLASGNAAYTATTTGGNNLGTYETTLTAFQVAGGYPNGVAAQQDAAWPYEATTIQAGFNEWEAAGYPPLPTVPEGD